MQFEWQEVHRTDYGESASNLVTERAEVPGGWLVRVIHVDYRGSLYGAGGVTFVPDPNHVWEVS